MNAADFAAGCERRIYERLVGLRPGERVTKDELQRSLDMSERAVRKAVEELRKKGVRVVSDCGAAGYRLAADDADYNRFEREYLAHAAAQFKTAKAMRETKDGQEEMAL